MKKTFEKILFVAVIMMAAVPVTLAQSGFYVPKQGKIFFNGDSATVFSDVLNQGNLGVGKNAVVNFKGQKWENDAQSLIPDESNSGTTATGIGGVVRFLSTDTTRQQLIGGYNAATRKGPAFSHLKIQSTSGVELLGGNAKVRNELQFATGLVYVKDNILLVGDATPGKIKGYDSLHYIVTDNLLNAGFLLRENIAKKDGLVIFPIGSKNNSYTPLGISSRASVPDNYFVNVSDGVKVDAFRGSMTQQAVGKTWQVGKQFRPNQDQVDITLQHMNQDEGAIFTPNKINAFVSQYLKKSWDTGYPQSLPGKGNMTSGQPLVNSGVNSRSFNGTIGSASYFTKITGKGDTSKVKTNLWFNGYRLDAALVRIYWKTNPEVFNLYFVVQRQLSNETGFSDIATLPTQSINGLSTSDLNYEIKDPNAYRGVSFYRLMMVDKFGNITYSNIIAVAGQPGKHKLLLWPNPTPDKFFIGLNGEVSVKTIVIWNAIGQKVYETPVNGRSIIEFYGFVPGSYMVGFISTTNKLIETKIAVVLGYK